MFHETVDLDKRKGRIVKTRDKSKIKTVLKYKVNIEINDERGIICMGKTEVSVERI